MRQTSRRDWNLRTNLANTKSMWRGAKFRFALFAVCLVSTWCSAYGDTLDETSVLQEFDTLYKEQYQRLWVYLNRLEDDTKANCGTGIPKVFRLATIGRGNAEYSEWVRELIEDLALTCTTEFVQAWGLHEDPGVTDMLVNPIFNEKELLLDAIRSSKDTTSRQRLLGALIN